MEGQASLFSPLLFLGFLLLFMYIVIIRPQNKRNKEINEMLSKLEVGSEVIAASGIIGKVKSIKGEYIAIEVSENVVFKLQRSAIANIPVVYGTRMIGGVRVFVSTNGTNNKYLYVAQVLAEGQINALSSILIDDNVVPLSS